MLLVITFRIGVLLPLGVPVWVLADPEAELDTADLGVLGEIEPNLFNLLPAILSLAMSYSSIVDLEENVI